MPRLPCFKFGHKIGKPDILKEFLHSGRSGFYHRVLSEGMIETGQEIKLVQRDPAGISIRTVLGMQKLNEGDGNSLRRALQIPSLAPVLRRDLEARLLS
jgi:MOSC domain-containing protein YiiM